MYIYIYTYIYIYMYTYIYIYIYICARGQAGSRTAGDPVPPAEVRCYISRFRRLA